MLILSLFPGIGLLDQGFEEAGFCVVRGPDLLWGGDVKLFHPSPGRFDGIIGGPPCKCFSSLSNIVRARYGDKSLAANLIPEFERCVAEAQPQWFLMENVRQAPVPAIKGYCVSSFVINNRQFGAEQNRVRRFSFGFLGDRAISILPHLEIVALEPLKFEYAALAGHGGSGTGLKFSGKGKTYPVKAARLVRMKKANNRSVADLLRIQGLPANMLDHAPFTNTMKKEVVGNGVPLPTARGIAKAVKKALQANKYL